MIDSDKRIIDILAERIRSLTQYNNNAEEAPRVILWLDAEKRFEKSIKVLQDEMPELLVLGKYDPAHKTGPAIWLRCAVAGTVQTDCPRDKTPIIYMPGAGIDDLDPEKANVFFKPLVPLEYMGRFFRQKSSKDITPFSFLGKTADGLGLDISETADTREALKTAMPRILKMRLGELLGQHINADYLNALIAGGDSINCLLEFINSGDKVFSNDESKEALKNLFKSKYGLDLDKDSQQSAAEMLANHSTHEWNKVWKRYEMAFDSYPNIEKQIRKCYYEGFMAPGEYSPSYEGWPQYNEQMESTLLVGLKNLTSKSDEEVMSGIAELDKVHSVRIETVWGKHDEARLARATAYLHKLVEVIKKGNKGTTIEALADHYDKDGYKVDKYALLSMEMAQNDEQTVCIEKLLSGFYRNYVDNLSKTFQDAVTHEGYPYKKTDKNYKKDTCILFVDGLRFDMARLLEEKLSGDKYDINETLFWCPFPSVTACGKYAVSPLVDNLVGKECDDYAPSFIESGTKINSTSFKKKMEEKGWSIISDASEKNSDFGWYSTRSIDKLGHEKQCDMAKQVDSLISEVEAKIIELLNAGWKYVNVVTDHGWLMIPGKMPKCELPGDMTVSNGGRCARMIEGVSCNYQQVPWSWKNEELVATGRGIGSFIDGREYAHGGLSLEECLTLQLEISLKEVEVSYEINKISWKGMACSFEVSGDIESIITDIRYKPMDGDSSLVNNKKSPDSDGHTRLLVMDEEADGKIAYIVLLSSKDGTVILQKKITIGG